MLSFGANLSRRNELEHLLDALRRFDALRDTPGGDVVNQATLDSITPNYADESVFDHLSPALVHALRQRGIKRLYEHQGEAILKAIKGNVVLQAPTASGKSLAFQLPMVDTLIRQPASHALMLYPNKALAQDQREQLRGVCDHVGEPRIESWWYDGDTPREEREQLRKHPPKILITNPDMLHNSFLGHADQWQGFFQTLQWVIVDEIHEYRGYFGSNVAMILRRFSHHLAQQRVHPQFFLCSATCANAKEHAQNLTGVPFEEVNANSSVRPKRQFFFVKPNIPDFRYWDILQLRTVNAGLACLASGKSVLAFCPTRKFAESCHSTAMRQIEEHRQSGTLDVDPETVKVFRAGLSAELRNTIQAGLKEGTVRLAFTTNALELGIDIGGLDGVILAGFPDSMMSAWQRIGRAGRSWKSDAFVLYFARNNPLDQFYAANLNTFLNKPLDDLVVNPENEDLIEKHVPSLLFETSGLDGGREILGDALHDAAAAKLDEGSKPVRTGRWRPHSQLDIRGGGGGNFELKEGSRTIGTLSRQQQFREAYERAVYMHGGKRYRVQRIIFAGSGGEIALGSVDQFLATNPAGFTTVSEQDLYAGKRWASTDIEVQTFHGKVGIMENIQSVEEIDDRTGSVRDRWQPKANSARFENAHAFWISQITRTEGGGDGILALQHLLRVGAIFSLPLDAYDIFPHAVAKDRKAYLVETYPGGIGVARKAMERWRNILHTGIKIAESCICRKGCPNCIVPPRSRQNLDKVSGIVLARSLLDATEHPHNFELRNGLWEPVRVNHQTCA